ncbi:unnamed protein product [Nezara viridula]|uniref:Uncharacterized protein n=1 Tax=Nezara viridula TaxID=85310 RepID=A0A9P0H9W9_NEZVI|nr:unnamed protein product [Nezara viridula]
MIHCLLEIIGFSSRIPLQLTRSGQFSSDCKRTFQSSSLPGIGSKLCSALNPLDYRLCSELEKMDDTEHPLTCKASNNLWSEQLNAFLKECCVLLLMTGHGD